MNPGWIVLVVSLVSVLVILASLRLRRDRAVDLGTVSHHWMAEQRLGRQRDLER